MGSIPLAEPSSAEINFFGVSLLCFLKELTTIRAPRVYMMEVCAVYLSPPKRNMRRTKGNKYCQPPANVFLRDGKLCRCRPSSPILAASKCTCVSNVP